jgi:hypothetical protein
MDRREEKRVHPPEDAVLEFAVWPAGTVPPPRLPLEALGPPRACSRSGLRLELADAAPLGLGLRLWAGPETTSALAEAPALFLYLKLRDYRYDDPGGVLSLFAHAVTAHADPQDGGVRFGLRITHQGRGSSFEKSIELLDVSRFGVTELAAWADAVDRRRQRREAGAADGLELETLLAEQALNDPAPATAKGNGS